MTSVIISLLDISLKIIFMKDNLDVHMAYSDEELDVDKRDTQCHVIRNLIQYKNNWIK